MRRGLEEYEIGGIKTTLPFFREVMRDPEFAAGRLDTGFIDAFMKSRRSGSDVDETERDIAIIAAALTSTRSKLDTSANTRQVESRWAAEGRRMRMYR
ncbi:hypothetical protein BH24ACI3_BH24ACI3_08940 [soil metagenome]